MENITTKIYWYVKDCFSHKYGFFETEEKAEDFIYLCRNTGSAIRKPLRCSVELSNDELPVFLKENKLKPLSLKLSDL